MVIFGILILSNYFKGGEVMETQLVGGRRKSAEKNLNDGANWFFWIAGLSVVNIIFLLTGSDRTFIIGLGSTQLIDIILSGTDSIVRGIGFAIDAFIVGIFMLLGFLARKKMGWCFIIGMIFYALDGLIYLQIKDYLSLGFHALVLYFLYKGYSALRELKKIDLETPRNMENQQPGLTSSL
jgi:hypothetical protein